MSGTLKRRQLRTDPAAAPSHPSHPNQVAAVRPGRMGQAELTICIAVAIVACSLIALIWLLTYRVVQEQQAEIRDHAEHALTAQAATLAETIGHELLMIDQSLTILQSAWKVDSSAFNLTRWQSTMPALTAVTDDLFIADERRVIRQDLLPKAVGQGIGSAYVTVPHGSLEQFLSDGSKAGDPLIIQSDAGAPIDARQFLMYVIRPLDQPAGWIIGASYRSEPLTRLFAEVALGNNAMIALIDTKHGVVQAIVGPASRRPKIDISKSALFVALSRAPAGLWVGDTPIDGTPRMHAFHRVADRDMAIVVAANWSEAMALADNLAAGADALAIVGSGVVLLIACVVLWEARTMRDNKRRKRAADRMRTEMERLRSEEALLTARVQLNAARLTAAVDSASDGIAVLDENLRLVLWNQLFQHGSIIALRPDMPLDDLFRTQAEAGIFGHVPDIEIEVNRRIALLQSRNTTVLAQLGPANETLILRSQPITEGGLLLLLSELQIGASAADSREIEPPAPPATAPSIEW